MRKRYLVLGASLILAIALAVPALGGPNNPVADFSANAKKTAKKALKKAKKANKNAKSAQSSADSASSSASAAQSSANEALAQQSKFSYETDTTGATTTLFEGGGLRIEGRCPTATNLEVDARSLADNSIIHVGTVQGSDVAFYEEDDNFDNNDTSALDADNEDDSVQGTFTFKNGQNGTIVTGTYLLEVDPGATNLDCNAYGTVDIV